MSEVFVKHGSAPGAAAAEAAYLRWLREGSTAVVEVLELDETANTVTIERVDSVRPTVDAAREAGRELATIHALGADAFGAPADGWDGPNFIGSREQSCVPTTRWAEFYTEQRVLPFAQHAVRAGNLDREGLRTVQRACEALVREDEDAARVVEACERLGSVGSADAVRSLALDTRSRLGDSEPAVVAVGAVVGSRPVVVVATNAGARDQGIRAGALVRTAAQVLGGGGGGKDDLAQGGGQNPQALDEALRAVAEQIQA